MELIEARLSPSHRIALVGDVHKGNRASHERAWQDFLRRLKNEDDLFMFGMGDYLESITVDDYRFSPDVHDGRQTPLNQYEELKNDLAPVRHKILGLLFGNHEHKLWRFGNLIKRLCEELEIPYGSFSAKLSVYPAEYLSKNPYYRGYFAHGSFGVTSRADDPLRRNVNMILSLKRRLSEMAGDCAIMGCGHIHRLLYGAPAGELYMYTKEGHLRSAYTKGEQHDTYIDPNLRHYVCTGSFLRSVLLGATTYSELAMYAPIQMGYQIVHVNNGNIVNVEPVHIGSDN